jgi:acyl dehydratase
MEVRFDDIESLEKLVSDDFGPFGEALEVSQKMIDDFAEVTGDHQWIHIDVDRAREQSPLGVTIAHGFLTLSLLPKLSGLTDTGYRIKGYGNAVNYGSDKLRFVGPVPAGCSVHMCSRLTSVDRKAKGTRVETEVAVHVVGNDRPALIYSMITLYQSKQG